MLCCVRCCVTGAQQVVRLGRKKRGGEGAHQKMAQPSQQVSRSPMRIVTADENGMSRP